MEQTVYYQTTDGNEFYKKSDALMHARTLKDRTVTPVAADGSGEVTEEAVESATEETEGTFRKTDNPVLQAITNPTEATRQLLKIVEGEGTDDSGELHSDEGTGEAGEATNVPLGEVGELTVSVDKLLGLDAPAVDLTGKTPEEITAMASEIIVKGAQELKPAAKSQTRTRAASKSKTPAKKKAATRTVKKADTGTTENTTPNT